MEVENQEREEKMQFEIKLHESKLKLQEDLQLKIGNLNQSAETPVSQAKLPKLVITKFNGTYADWPRFWGQYSESIGKSSVPPVSKFTYLRELLDARVRKTVEALPQTAEGYNRALSILKDRFGKESEIVKAYVKEILGLPYTPTGNPKRIHEFYEKLSYSVQSLETLKSLHEVNGMVSLTLENSQQSEETSYETILTGKPGISSNLPKHFASGRAETRWFISKQRIHRNTGIRNETACFKLSRKRHASVFTVKRMTTNHQNVAKSPHRRIANNFWPRRSFVSIALALTNHRNAKVPQHVKPVVDGIILQSAVCQRK